MQLYVFNSSLTKENLAFSLVELSIVLVILGLLTGGILTGQSLIKAAELRSVSTDFGNYAAAINSFKTKYLNIPGELTNATSFWGDNVTHCSDGNAANNGSPGTCNGNGDGVLDHATGGAGTEGEMFMFWNQLALAGLVEGQYTGLAGTANGYHAIIDANIPKSRYANAGWSADNWNVASGSSGSAFQINYNNHLVFGLQASNDITSGKVLTPEEAWNIDKKMDDGKPGYGKIIAHYWNNQCSAADDGSSAATDLNASYRLSDTTAQCALFFINFF